MAGMCTRFVADLDWGELGLEFDAELSPGLPQPSWNLRPTQKIALLAQDSHGTKHLAPAAWSFVPAWSQTDRLEYPTFNARAETVLTKRTWSQSAHSMRALIPMTGYYEWSSKRRPWYFFSADGTPLLVAGLYSWWSRRLTCTILTRDAVAGPATVHDRMPVLVRNDMLARWLSPAVPGTAIIPDVAERSADISMSLQQHEVAPITGDGPELIEPLPGHSDAVHNGADAQGERLF